MCLERYWELVPFCLTFPSWFCTISWARSTALKGEYSRRVLNISFLPTWEQGITCMKQIKILRSPPCWASLLAWPQTSLLFVRVLGWVLLILSMESTCWSKSESLTVPGSHWPHDLSCLSSRLLWSMRSLALLGEGNASTCGSLVVFGCTGHRITCRHKQWPQWIRPKDPRGGNILDLSLNCT